MEDQPTVGAWYETDDGKVFVVVGVDGARGPIDVQFLDGEVEQLDLEIWAALDLTQVEPPEEWHKTMEDFFHERGRRR